MGSHPLTNYLPPLTVVCMFIANGIIIDHIWFLLCAPLFKVPDLVKTRLASWWPWTATQCRQLPAHLLFHNQLLFYAPLAAVPEPITYIFGSTVSVGRELHPITHTPPGQNPIRFGPYLRVTPTRNGHSPNFIGLLNAPEPTHNETPPQVNVCSIMKLTLLKRNTSIMTCSDGIDCFLPVEWTFCNKEIKIFSNSHDFRERLFFSHPLQPITP